MWNKRTVSTEPAAKNNGVSLDSRLDSRLDWPTHLVRAQLHLPVLTAYGLSGSTDLNWLTAVIIPQASLTLR